MSDNDMIRRGDALECFMGYDRTGDIKDAIAALPAMTVRVKPLVWEERDGKSYRQANCVFGQYQVSWLVEFECWQLSSPRKAGQAWKDGFSRHSNKDAAKAAAQRDYEARILAALEPVQKMHTLPAPTDAALDMTNVQKMHIADPAAIREEALREAAALCFKNADGITEAVSAFPQIKKRRVLLQRAEQSKVDAAAIFGLIPTKGAADDR